MSIFSSFFGVIRYLCVLVLIQLTLVCGFLPSWSIMKHWTMPCVSKLVHAGNKRPFNSWAVCFGMDSQLNTKSLLHGDSCDISSFSGFSFHPFSMLMWALQLDSEKCLVQLCCCAVKYMFSTGFYLVPFICWYYLYTGRQCVWVGKQFSHSVFPLVKNMILALSNLEL